jgi:hypothetical protein
VRKVVFGVAVALGVATVGSAWAVTKPGRTQIRQGPITALALDHSSIAFVVGRTKTHCEHVELWNPDLKGTWRFGPRGPCTNVGSTGMGITSVSVATNRVAWITYNGGNFRDWLLLTATATQKRPRQLRLVSRDVEAPGPPPIVLGAGSSAGIPYAVGSTLVLLRPDGARAFAWTAPAPVVSLTSGPGPGDATVVAVLSTGEVDVLAADGSMLDTYSYPAGAVTSVALAPAGALLQAGSIVEIRRDAVYKRLVELPATAQLLAFAERRILYALGGSVRTLHIGTGADSLLVRGSSARPVLARLDPHGFAWARGSRVSWDCGACITF